MRTFLQLLRDDPASTYIHGIDSAVTPSVLSAAIKDFFDNSVWGVQIVDTGSDVHYDLRRLWAYQLVVSHFYSNDHIDFVYSADLFRSLISYFVWTAGE